MESDVKINCADYSALFRTPGQFLRLAVLKAQRFFTQYVLLMIQKLHNHIVMEGGRCAHMDGCNLIIQKNGRIRSPLFNGEFFGKCLCLLLTDIDDSSN